MALLFDWSVVTPDVSALVRERVNAAAATALPATPGVEAFELLALDLGDAAPELELLAFFDPLEDAAAAAAIAAYSPATPKSPFSGLPSEALRRKAHPVAAAVSPVGARLRLRYSGSVALRCVGETGRGVVGR